MGDMRVTGAVPQRLRVNGAFVEQGKPMRGVVVATGGGRVIVRSVVDERVSGRLTGVSGREFVVGEKLTVELAGVTMITSGELRGRDEASFRLPASPAQSALAQAAEPAKRAPVALETKISRTVKQDGEKTYLVSIGGRNVAVPQRLRTTANTENLDLLPTGVFVVIEGTRYEAYYEEGFVPIAQQIVSALVAKTSYRIGSSDKVKMSEDAKTGIFLVEAKEYVPGTHYCLNGIVTAVRGDRPGQFNRAHGHFFLNTEGSRLKFTAGTLDARALIREMVQGPLRVEIVAA